MSKEQAHEPGRYPWSYIAESAYKAYAASTGNKNFQGNPMPVWKDLPLAIRTAWEAAVRQAGNVLRHLHEEGDESRWTGWQPPG